MFLLQVKKFAWCWHLDFSWHMRMLHVVACLCMCFWFHGNMFFHFEFACCMFLFSCRFVWTCYLISVSPMVFFCAKALFLEFDWHWIGIVFLELALMFWFTITISLVYFLLELIAPIVFVDFYKTWIRQSKMNNANPNASQQKKWKIKFLWNQFQFWCISKQ